MTNENSETSVARIRTERLRGAAVRARILASTIEDVLRNGLTVSFTHLPMEGYIARAGVPRSSVYRQWGTHDDFVAALLTHTFDSSIFTDRFDTAMTVAAQSVLDAHVDRLGNADGRRAVAQEMIRAGITAYLGHLLHSETWILYNTVASSAESLIPGQTRTVVDEIIARVEGERSERLTAFYTLMITRCHARLRDGCTPAQLADLTTVLVDGFARRLRRGPTPLDIDISPIAEGTARWPLVSHSVCSVIDGMILDYEGT